MVVSLEGSNQYFKDLLGNGSFDAFYNKSISPEERLKLFPSSLLSFSKDNRGIHLTPLGDNSLHHMFFPSNSLWETPTSNENNIVNESK